MSEQEVKTEKLQTAYMMVTGEGAMAYRLLEVHLAGDRVVEMKEIGLPDLKSVVLGRLLRLIVRL